MRQPPKRKLRKDRGLRPFAVANALDLQQARETGSCCVCGYRGRALLFVAPKPGGYTPTAVVKSSRGVFLRSLAECKMMCCNCETERRVHLRRAPNRVVYIHSQGAMLKQLAGQSPFVKDHKKSAALFSENINISLSDTKKLSDVEPVILKLDIPE